MKLLHQGCHCLGVALRGKRGTEILPFSADLGTVSTGLRACFMF